MKAPRNTRLSTRSSSSRPVILGVTGALGLGLAAVMTILPAAPAGAAATGACEANATSLSAVTSLAGKMPADKTMKQDTCGNVFVKEGAPRLGPAAVTQLRTVTAPAPLQNTFELESLPGSEHTIYLDFNGVTLSGTAFNDNFGLPVVAATPFSLSAPADTNFTDTELTAIQRAWKVVSEDFAPFNVNVTTREPRTDALSRSSAADNTWGVTVVATTGGGPLQTACQCGGLAYLNSVAETGALREDHQPGFVFGALTPEGVGEAISHEAGHMFGLFHDGTATKTYYDGSQPWAPIMGTGSGQPVTQWSAGEYDGANNTQDDVAIIAQNAGFRVDDHGNDALSASPLHTNASQAGVISTRTDIDAFSFTAAGQVTIQVTVLNQKADLDVELQIIDSKGRTVAQVEGSTHRASRTAANGLGATWTAQLSQTAKRYTVLIDGVGTSATGAGGYSDYASLGQFNVQLTR